jgi:hypothetical protein
MEITYDTGAKVILEGPAMYEVESKNSGFLLIGKLTGRVAHESAKGFSISTRTATVTDLGTEFGVEIKRDGAAEVVVLDGMVRLAALGTNGDGGQERVLRVGQSGLVVTHDGATDIHVGTARGNRFIRSCQTAGFLIGRTTNNGSFEDPAVGPDNRTFWTGPPANVAAMVGACPTHWHGPITLQTAGRNSVGGVSGEQYAVLDHNGLETWCTLTETYEANTTYTLSADVGSNGSNKPLITYFKDADRTVSFSRSATTRIALNSLDSMPHLVLDTAAHPEFVGKSIQVGFLNTSSADHLDRYQIYVDNVVLRKALRAVSISQPQSRPKVKAADNAPTTEDAR